MSAAGFAKLYYHAWITKFSGFHWCHCLLMICPRVAYVEYLDSFVPQNSFVVSSHVCVSLSLLRTLGGWVLTKIGLKLVILAATHTYICTCVWGLCVYIYRLYRPWYRPTDAFRMWNILLNIILYLIWGFIRISCGDICERQFLREKWR